MRMDKARYKKICEMCGKEFYATLNNKKFCDEYNCKQRRARERYLNDKRKYDSNGEGE